MPDTLEGSRIQKALVVFLAFTGFAVGYACTYAATATTFILPLTEQFGWGRLIPSLMFVAAMLGVVIASFFLGGIIERLGEARVAAISGVCLATVMVLLSMLSGSPAMAVGLALLAGLLGAGTGVGLYVAILPKWFDRGLGRALGIAVIGQSVGSALMPPISAGIIAARGWREAYLALAAIEVTVTLVIAAVLAKLLKSKKQASNASSGAVHDGFTLREALRQKNFWLLETAIFLQTLGMFGVSFHLFPIYHDLGLDWSLLSRVTIAIAVGLAIGRLISGVLLDLIEARLVALGMFGLGALAIAWIATLTSVTGGFITYVPPVLVGIAFGSESDILAYLARRLFGLRHFAVIYNRLLMGFFMGAMAGPTLLGWAFDNLSDPRLGLWGLAASCGLAVIVSLFLPPVRRSADIPAQT